MPEIKEVTKFRLMQKKIEKITEIDYNNPEERKFDVVKGTKLQCLIKIFYKLLSDKQTTEKHMDAINEELNILLNSG